MEITIVRNNLMQDVNYNPYCGNPNYNCMHRTKFNGEQFICRKCYWVSQFPQDFINRYKEKHGL